MTRQAAIAQLRDILSSLYSDLTSAQRIADDSGLNSSNIAFSSRATDNWHAILAEAEKVGKTDEIIALAQKEYGANQKLQTAITDLRASTTQPPTSDRTATNQTPPQPDDAPQVFVSYGKEDSAAALDLYHKLKDTGFRPWIDQEDILPGEKWDLKIRNTLKGADFLLICLSSASVQRRGYIQREINIALDVAEELPEGSIFLIPIRFDDCDVPSRLAAYQYVDLYSPNGLERVIRAIRTQWERA